MCTRHKKIESRLRIHNVLELNGNVNVYTHAETYWSSMRSLVGEL